MNSSDGVMAGGVIVKGFKFFEYFDGFERFEQGAVWRESSYINDRVRGSNIRVVLNEFISIIKGFTGDFIDWGGMNLFCKTFLNFASISLGSVSILPALVPSEVILALPELLFPKIGFILFQNFLGFKVLSLPNSPMRDAHWDA